MILRNKLQPQNEMTEFSVIFLHVFDKATGAYAHSEPVDFVRPDELLATLDYLTTESREKFGSNFIMETVTLAEITLPDFEWLLRRLKAQDELHRFNMAIGAYLSEHLAA